MSTIWYPNKSCDPYIISTLGQVQPDFHPDQITSKTERQKILSEIFANPPIIGHIPWRSTSLFIPATNPKDEYIVAGNSDTRRLRRHLYLGARNLLRSWRLFEVRLDHYLGLMLFFANQNANCIQGYYSHNRIIGHAKFLVDVAGTRIPISYSELNITPQPIERCWIKEYWPDMTREITIDQRWYIPPTIVDHPPPHF